MKLALIAAVAENGVIGRQGALPWRLPADLQRFKSLTMGRAIIMGRKTWESIGRQLPGRRMIVVSRHAGYETLPGVKVASDVPSAIQAAATHDNEQAFIIGGAEIYRLALPLADRLLLTRVHATVEGDAQFPPIDWTHWRLQRSERHAADAQNEFDYSFDDYERVVT